MRLVQCHIQVRAADAAQAGGVSGSLGVSFEQARERLEEIPSLYFEGDGSFFWTDSRLGTQIWGMLYDRPVQSTPKQEGSQLDYCEIQGEMAREQIEIILNCIALQPSVVVVLELPQGKRLTLEEFYSRWEIE